MLAVIFVLAATLTLLPAVLAKLGPRVDKLALPWAHSGEHRSPRFAALGRAAVAPARPLRRRRARDPGRARAAGHAAEDRDAVDQGRPDLATPPASATTRCSAAFGPGATGPLQIVTPAAQATRGRADREPRSGRRGADAHADQRRLRADHRDPQAGPVQPGRRPDDRPAPRRAAGRVADRRRGGREPRPPGRAVGQDPARDRRGPRRSGSCCC